MKFILKHSLLILALVSLTAQALTPIPIDPNVLLATTNIIVRVTPDQNGSARYWWYKAKFKYPDGTITTLYCGKYDILTSLTQPATGQDEYLSAYLTRNISSATMSAEDQAWCLQ